MRKPLSLRRAEARTAARSADAPANGADTDRQIARINELTRAGRANWFGLLAYLAFTLVTVLGVSDADFFIDSRQTQLPLIGVSIPTFAFFTFAPILGAALHVYLHLLIRKATEALAEPPPVIGERTLETQVQPWLLNDLVLRMRRDGAAPRRPLDWIAGVTAMLLIWCAGPYVLALMWLRSFPAHDEKLSLLIALCLGLTIYASLQSWAKMRADIRRPWLATRVLSTMVFALSFAIWAALSAVTLVRTEGGIDHLIGEDRPGLADWPLVRPAIAMAAEREIPFRWRDNRLLVSADLSGVVFAALPPDQSNRTMARSNFRRDWCARNGMEFDICGPADDKPDHLYVTRSYWCQSNGLPSLDDCRRRFDDLEAGFESEWAEFRRETLKTLQKPSLAGRDLRKANLTNADLFGVDLSYALLEYAHLPEARLEGTDLRSARMERAVLNFARMENADLSYALMQDANFREARMDGAILVSAQMEGASLIGAQMEGARLSRAQMKDAVLLRANLQHAILLHTGLDDADLAGANLTHADLTRAQLKAADLIRTQMTGTTLFGAEMTGANLGGAEIVGADLRETTLRGTNWSGAEITASVAHHADLRGSSGLPEGQWSSVIGNAATLLPEPEPGMEPPYVCSCWQAAPPGVDHLFALFTLDGFSREQVRSAPFNFFCAPGEQPLRTGTVLARNAKLPWVVEGVSADDWARAEDARRRVTARQGDFCEAP